jgi:hypothetical protein
MHVTSKRYLETQVKNLPCQIKYTKRKVLRLEIPSRKLIHSQNSYYAKLLDTGQIICNEILLQLTQGTLQYKEKSFILTILEPYLQ